MPRSNCLFIFLLTNFLQQSKCLYSIYRLDEETPSFAIHGINLNRLGTTTIYGRNGSDFLVDYSQRGCLNKPDHLTNNGSSKSTSQIINCFDPFPLSINGGIPGKDGCKEVMPYDQNFTHLLYMCSFKIPSTYQLIVKSLDQAVSLEYAISFRVSKWVDESRHTLVVPTNDSSISDERYGNNVLLRANTLAIIVLNPLVYRPGNELAPFIYFTPIASYSKDFCLVYLPDLNCPSNSSYSVYVGGDPGLVKSFKYHIDDEQFPSNMEFNLPSSVITVLVERNDCTFCLHYTVDDDYEYQELFETNQIYFSNNYLWPLEDPNDFPDCISMYATPISFWEASSEIRIEFLAFEGIHMNITGFKNRLGNNRCIDPILTYEKSFVSSPGNLTIEIDCLQFHYCPTVSNRERFGFKALIIAKLANATEEDCASIYELSEQEPQAIFNTFSIAVTTLSSFALICVFQDCPPGTICPLVVDFSISCSRQDRDLCSNPYLWSIIEINNEIPPMSNCTMWESLSNVTMLVQCKIIVNQHVYFRKSPLQAGSVYLTGAVSVRALQWTNDDTAFYLMPTSVLIQSNPVLDIVFPTHEQEAWISMSLAIPNSKVLRSFTSSHVDDCDYPMIIGPPDRKNLHPERNLVTYRGKNRFIEYYPESELLSFLIPPGCTPSIVLVQLGTGIFADEYEEKEQEICDGVSIITSHGYLNPFMFDNEMFGYYLIRNITCPSFKVNVTFEVISIGDGELTIVAFERDLEIKASCDLNVALPMNCSVSGVSKVQIQWQPHTLGFDRQDQCFIKVHLSRSNIPFTPSTNSPMEMIIPSQSFGSIPYHLLAIFIVLLGCIAALPRI